MLRRLWEASIWHPEAIPATEGQTSSELKRYVLPVFDALITVMGISAIVNGMPSFNLVYAVWVPNTAAIVLAVAGLSAALGISFPRLWWAEAAGKIAMLLVLGGYAAAMWILIAQGDTNRAFTAAGLTALLIPPLWSLARLGRERQGRRSSPGGDV